MVGMVVGCVARSSTDLGSPVGALSQRSTGCTNPAASVCDDAPAALVDRIETPDQQRVEQARGNGAQEKLNRPSVLSG